MRKKRRGIRAMGTVLLAALLTVLLGFSSVIQAQTITVAGSNWNVTVPPITEAGADYGGTYDNPADLTLSGTIPGSVLNLLSGGAVEVTVVMVPSTWHSSLRLYAKRTGGSTNISGLCVLCSATINGGLSYIEIPTESGVQLFTINFSGPLGLFNSVSYSNIMVQQQMRGVSVTTPVDNYSADVVFTISTM